MRVPLGWWTDLEVARRSGAQLGTDGDTTVVRTADNPGYWWGNFILVPGDTPEAVARQRFREYFPDAAHEAIGLLDRPAPRGWTSLSVEGDEVRIRRGPPRADPVDGYTVRPLRGPDWRAAWRNETAGLSAEYADFAWRRIETRQRLVADGAGMFMGAFTGEDLVADLGIVQCGSVARYQSVSTLPDHRGRGLASWLLARAGQWAAQRGAERWVIIVEPDSDAARLYARLGFTVLEKTYRAQREPV